MARLMEWTAREARLTLSVPIYGDNDQELEAEALRICDAVDAAHTMTPPEGTLPARLNKRWTRVRRALAREEER
jgi:hypothetical protein